MQILIPPVPVAGPPDVAGLGVLVTADAVVRHGAGQGRAVAWAAAVATGGLASQHAAEEELAREGVDRRALGRERFAARVRALEERGRSRLASVATALGVDLAVTASSVDGSGPARAARTAFVRLFDAGLLQDAEAVAEGCPRCATVLDPEDALPGEAPAESLTLRLAVAPGPGHLEVATVAPELLAGAVAVVVPEGHAHAGRSAVVPVAGRTVAVLADVGVTEPRLLVPAHDPDPAALALARGAGLLPVGVLDAAGVLRAPGPLDGLARYAARSACRRMLAAEGALVGARQVAEEVRRCRRCGTVAVARLARWWCLALAELEVDAADAVREGWLSVSPPAARDELLAGAGASPPWCLGHQVWAGQPLPVGACRECGHLEVAVDLPPTCGRCMGDLVVSADVLDARFVGCTWPLAVAGWPLLDDAAVAERARRTAMIAGSADVGRWVLPMAALGLRLAGSIPFAHLAVVPAPEGAPAAGTTTDVVALTARHGRAAIRAALVCGGLDVAAGADVVARCATPGAGDTDVDGLAAACADAYEDGAPARALGLLAAAARRGVPAGQAERFRALAAPALGD